jgi:hypothetical protein
MIQKIKVELIYSCINNDPKTFLPFLMLAEVETEPTDKNGFYQFFKGILNHAHESSVGKVILKIEQPTWEIDKEALHYNLYDNIHKHPLLSIVVKEYNNLIYLGVMPF